ncbi:MAG TPA: low temperature requirement protein A [Acidimicrobiales bacterium]|jgi:low temperature requirement protein LtrA
MPILSPLAPRDPAEGHRAATPLELFFDLTFVVAVAEAASGLEHGLVNGHPRAVLIGYPLVFFAIWWAWMNFTWFASAYDDDDVAYRIAVLVQMTGVLILAAGVSRALGGGDFAIILVGYLVMRLSMVTLWLQVAASDRDRRQCTLRYAVALWPEAVGRTSWHPDHIAERYGLFTIIVLDETLLAPTVGVEEALNGRTTFGHLALVAVGGLLIVFSMWWLNFDMPSGRMVEQVREAFTERLSGASSGATATTWSSPGPPPRPRSSWPSIRPPTSPD